MIVLLYLGIFVVGAVIGSQLNRGIYRLAWSQRTGVPVERISAGFYIVGTGELRRPDTDRALATLLRLT